MSLAGESVFEVPSEWCENGMMIFLAIGTSSSRSGAFQSRVLMSYHAGITIPMLMVTGISGACGKTKRVLGHPRSGTTGSKSWPLAPRPCNQMTVLRCSSVGSTTTDMSVSPFAMNLAVKEVLFAVCPPQRRCLRLGMAEVDNSRVLSRTPTGEVRD